jgi:excinuclease UvrABC ATPase subunit
VAEGGLHPRPHRRRDHEIEEAPALDKKYKHDIEVVVDRLVVRPGIETRLAHSFETALKLAEGLAYVDLVDTTVAIAGRKVERNAPPAKHHQEGLPPRDQGLAMPAPASPPTASPSPRNSPAPSRASPSPRSSRALFSFNAPQGACPACDGLGEKLYFDPQLVVPNEGAVDQAGRGRALGQVQSAQPLLHAGAGQPRQGLRLQAGNAVERAFRGRSATSILHGTAARRSR